MLALLNHSHKTFPWLSLGYFHFWESFVIFRGRDDGWGYEFRFMCCYIQKHVFPWIAPSFVRAKVSKFSCLESDSDTLAYSKTYGKNKHVCVISAQKSTCLAHSMLRHNAPAPAWHYGARHEKNLSDTPECLSLGSHEESGYKIHCLTFICWPHTVFVHCVAQ